MSNAGAYRQYANAATSGHTKISILSLTPLNVVFGDLGTFCSSARYFGVGFGDLSVFLDTSICTG